MKKVGVIACAKKKQDFPCEAWKMYDKSQQFKAQRIFMDCVFDEWYIISAKHGFMEPNKFIEPYDAYLGDNNRIPNTQALTQDKIDEWVELIDKQFPNKEEIELHCHMSTMYFKYISKIFPNTIHIKPKQQQNLTAKYYTQATENYMGEVGLNTIYDVLNKPHKVHEQPRWWYHNEHGEVYGTQGTISCKYGVNQGGLHHMISGHSLHIKGWVIDKSLLKDIHKSPSGRYSYKGEKTPTKKWNNELVNKVAELDNKYGKRMSLGEVYDILNKPHRVYEQPRWWYHNEYDDFFGTTGQLGKKYDVDSGNLTQIIRGYSLQTAGWVIDKSLLKDIHKSPSGRYSYKGDKKPTKKWNNGLVDKLAELDNKYGKRR